MPEIKELLLGEGICALPELYSRAEIAAINNAIDPILLSRIESNRAYVHADEFIDLGIWDQVFSSGMKNLLFSIMPDPVLYHCHMYEIAAGNTQSHIFADSLMGWHRDPDSLYVKGDLTHVSIFVYLTDVGPEDGAFEFVPCIPPTKWLRNGTDYISVQGPPGYSFAWHRNYYHRASPNRGPVRRRLLKLSIQRNEFPSAHLQNPNFTRVLAGIPAGDMTTDILLGRYQGKAAPQVPSARTPRLARLPVNGKLELSGLDLTKAQLREKALGMKRKLKGNSHQVVAAYD